MFRILVGVLAAFVGFSFGHSIPKWMENKSKPASTPPSSASIASPPPLPPRKLFLRRKSLRKFRFGSHRSSKESAEGDASSRVFISPSSDCDHADHRHRHRFKFGVRKPAQDKMQDESSLEELGQASTSENSQFPHQDMSAKNVIHSELKYLGCGFATVSTQSNVSGAALKEKNQMKQWKIKLMGLRSKAKASENVWYDKFENENLGGKIAAVAPSKLKPAATVKENESPLLLMSSAKKDFSWSRSSSRVGLLGGASKSSLER